MPPGSLTVPLQFANFDDDIPLLVICPSCETKVLTRVESKHRTLAWVASLALVCLGCIGGCCLIPFCIKDLKEFRHICPKCGALIGKSREKSVLL